MEANIVKVILLFLYNESIISSFIDLVFHFGPQDLIKICPDKYLYQ